MNVFAELRNRLSLGLRRRLDVPSDHERPQDEIPEERITLRIVEDYQRMYGERQTLIDYIRSQEAIYKDAQRVLYRLVMRKAPTRRKIMEELKLLLYDMTFDHMKAQQTLRKGLGMECLTDKEEE